MDASDYPYVVKHVFESRHLDKFMTWMAYCLDTDRLTDLLDWEEIRTALHVEDQDMHYTSYCLKKEYDRQFELYKLYLLLSTKYGYCYDRPTMHLTYSDEIYKEVSYYEPTIHEIQYEMLEPSIFARWENLFTLRSKLSAAADYTEVQIGGTNAMRWNPTIGYLGTLSRSNSSSHKFKRLNSSREVDSSNNPTALVSHLKRLRVPMDAICKAIDKNNLAGINHSTFLDETDNTLLRWITTIVLEHDEHYSSFLQDWKWDTVLALECVPLTQPDE